MFENLKEDARIFRAKHRDHGRLAYLYYPDYRVALIYRAAQWAFLHKMKPVAYLLTMLNDFLNGVWIGPRVSIGKGVTFGHPRGLVINPNTRIGNYCTFLNNVTLGGPRITIGDFVEVGASACIISRPDRPIEIGSHAIIGAGSVVTRSVQPNSIVAGNPARVIKEKDLEQWLADRPFFKDVVASE